MNKLVNYFQASYTELQKVIWPSRRQAIKLTLIVLVFSTVIAMLLGGLDWVWRTALQTLIMKAN